MKTTSIIALIAASGLASAGLAHTFDITGDMVDGFAASIGDNGIHDFGSAGKITNVSWDITFTTVAPSWGSEASFAIDTDSGFAEFFAADAGLPEDPGTYTWTGSTAISLDSADGFVLLTLFDTFDDAGIDFVVDLGSVTVDYLKVPAPGAAALLGLGGLVATRRRR